MLKYMLDTNIIIYAINQRPAQVREALTQHERPDVYLCRVKR